MKESAGKKKGNASTGHGNRCLARILDEAAFGASRTNTFLGERYRRHPRARRLRPPANTNPALPGASACPLPSIFGLVSGCDMSLGQRW